MRNRSKWILCMGLAFTMAASVTLSGCGTGKKDSGKTEIELVQYKPEAVKAFEKLEEKFQKQFEIKTVEKKDYDEYEKVTYGITNEDEEFDAFFGTMSQMFSDAEVIE